MKTKKLLFTAITILTSIASAQAQNVNVSDSNFKAALVGNASINTNMDAEIQITEANAYSGSINVSNSNISDLTGIEAFVALDSLDCSLNHISGLDVSANIAFTYLDCSGNMESSLLVIESGGWSTSPYYVFVYYMDSLDVSANTSLTTLKCNNNGLLSLNTTGLSALTYLECSSNGRLQFDTPNYYVISTPIFD